MSDSHPPIAVTKHSAKHSATMHVTANFLRRQLWVWPILAAVVFGGVGLWVHGAVENAMREQRLASLATILKTEEAAIDVWIGEQRINAELLSRDERLAPLVHELLAHADAADAERQLVQTKAQELLRARLKEPIRMSGYHGFYMIAPNGMVLAADHDIPIGKTLTGYRKEYQQQLMSGKSGVSKPYLSRMPLLNEKGEQRANIPTMLTAAPILEAGKPIAILALRIRPDDHFTRILRVASAGKTGETYAFDKNGVLLSESRHDEELKQIGLIPDQADSRSILALELRDPGVNMVTGGRPVKRRTEQPLTLMAAEATQGNEGFNVDGYNDYRGVPVVGAWKWLDQHDFGIATEIAVAEAFQPVYVLRRAFWILMGLLLVSALGIFGAMLFIKRQQHALQVAALTAKQLGQYTLEHKIGAGGMGTVYRAHHALLRRPTAVKLLDIDKISDAAIARFQREVQLTSQLNHPNTIAIYDYGKTPEGIFFYAMEFLDGLTLEDIVARHGPLPEGRVVRILEQICGSLAEAHGIGLIHRDIKPANIILNHRGGVADLVKVLDFGLVKSLGAEHEANVTAANALTGTPLYLSPESIDQPDTIDTRSDLYAIGAVGYFLLTGTPVFSGKSIVEICMHHVRTPPEPPSQRLGRAVSQQLEAVILSCLAKDRAARPASARVIQEMLARCAAAESWSLGDAEKWWLQFRQATIVAPVASTGIVEGGATVAYQ
jgi:eukaryotic-like serine/threonine-protein kinase